MKGSKMENALQKLAKGKSEEEKIDRIDFDFSTFKEISEGESERVGAWVYKNTILYFKLRMEGDQVFLEKSSREEFEEYDSLYLYRLLRKEKGAQP